MRACSRRCATCRGTSSCQRPLLATRPMIGRCRSAKAETISQPYMVGSIAAALAPGPPDRVLEVGTGSGYQAAILARLARSVVTIERHPSLAARAGATFAALGISNVRVVIGDGSNGYRPAPRCRADSRDRRIAGGSRVAQGTARRRRPARHSRRVGRISTGGPGRATRRRVRRGGGGRVCFLSH